MVSGSIKRESVGRSWFQVDVRNNLICKLLITISLRDMDYWLNFGYRYYLATTEQDPAQQHLYKVSLTATPYKSECLSCNARSKFDGTQCLYNTAKFSTNNSHYVLTCAGPGVPETSVHDKVSLLTIFSFCFICFFISISILSLDLIIEWSTSFRGVASDKLDSREKTWRVGSYNGSKTEIIMNRTSF